MEQGGVRMGHTGSVIVRLGARIRAATPALLGVSSLVVAVGCGDVQNAGDLASAPHDDDLQAEDDLGSAEQALGPAMVGVFPGAGSNCPNGAAAGGLWYDNENNNNNNSRSGWIGDTYSARDTGLRWCIVDGSLFRPMRGINSSSNYAVVKASASCPSGSVEVIRYSDGDDASYDTSGTDAGGNVTSGGNATLHLCMFRSNPSAPSFSFPAIGISYGVLGGSGLPGTIEYGQVYMDDEDTRNNNKLDGSTAGSEAFLTAGSNTRLFFSRVR